MSISLVAFGWLIIKLLVLAFVFFGLKYLCQWLGVNLPEMLWKILAAILVIIGIILVLVFLGVT